MKNKKLFLIALLLLVVLFLGSCSQSRIPSNQVPSAGQTALNYSAPAPAFKLKMASFSPMDVPTQIEYDPFQFTLDRWADTIEEQSGGRIKFDRYPRESLIKMPDMWYAAENGLVDVVIVDTDNPLSAFPQTNILKLPGLFPSASIASLTVYSLYQEGYFSDELKGVKLLFPGCNYPADVGSRVKQIKTMADFKDQKIAVTSRIEASTIQAIGGIPVTIQLTDQFVALQRGIVDGSWLDLHGQVAFNFFQTEPYMTYIGFGNVKVIWYVMNLNTYNSLPLDLQAIIDSNSGLGWTLFFGKRCDQNYARSHFLPG